ncbi:MAG: Nucleotidyl transferase [Microgenomates group bacterium GW2011_GWC1_37_8]|uniref:glucose-1-phosphate thymidylyltransferase n=1 Tax=Candidatus Woesebacteria bacterium GW2011_GWB1_38_8 TaxID=1618570 RepID=A0A0G0NK39_9BACT|nr:MAG: Nucleotidyl transferase [Microgenomates group bacterium GW2011_GWC1_37_8]KKQ86259.1 MAG: Nucleotidyl transferase [Candidatus Woesebacteria bacterium GW2011_GWB1_38_8]
MKGIILAGGNATRLRPLTKITSKQLLPVYDRPMIYYPIQTLVSSGIKDILIIISPLYSGHFLNLLGSGKEFDARFSFAIQDEPRGLADAFIVGKDFLDNDNVTMILGDNIFDNHGFSKEIQSFKSGAMVFAKKVTDPQRFGVVEFDKKGNVLSIEEKPKKPKSNYAVVGLYTFDSRVVEYAKNLTPSARGEIEITDLNNMYLKKGKLKVKVFEGLWADAGTFDSLLEVSNYMAQKAKNK